MPSPADPNGGRKPGEPFRYRPGTLLEPGEELQLRMLACGRNNLTHEETAAVLGCSRTHLELFWKANPDHRQAFDDGKQMRKVILRAQGDIHAKLDPATWRFLAKNELGLSDDPSKAKLDEQATKALKGMSREEANKRILELTPKLIGEQRIVSRETYTTQEQSNAQAAVDANDPVEPGRGQAEIREVQGQPAGGQRRAVNASGRPLLAGAAAGGRAHNVPPEAAQDVLEALQKRLAEIEASAVRKNPRKDGQPHTDRTKLSEAAKGPRKEGPDRDANRDQDNRPAHAPARLPGRLGDR